MMQLYFFSCQNCFSPYLDTLGLLICITLYRCGHCKQLTPEYEKAAAALKGVVKLVAVDATAHESLAQKYQIQGFPTIKVFGADKRSPVDYQGARTADALISQAMKSANQLVKDRKAGKSSSSKGSSSNSGGDSAGTGEKKTKKKSEKKKSAVQELDEASFNALVLDSNEHWLVEFYAPWYVYMIDLLSILVFFLLICQIISGVVIAKLSLQNGRKLLSVWPEMVLNLVQLMLLLILTSHRNTASKDILQSNFSQQDQKQVHHRTIVEHGKLMPLSALLWKVLNDQEHLYQSIK